MHARAGYSKTKITPEVPYTLAGYDVRHGESEGVHDELYARCLILEVCGKPAVFISLDILGVDEVLVQEIKNTIAEMDMEINKDGIFVFATHTHSGPSSAFSGRKSFRKEYFDLVVSRCGEAFTNARGDVYDSVIYSDETYISGIASKRNVCGKPENDSGIKCNVLRIIRNRGEIMFINFPCHMTVLDEKNLLFSKDMIYGLDRALTEKGIGDFIFANGAAGDISTRFYKKEASFGEAKRLGEILAERLISMNSKSNNEMKLQNMLFKKSSFLLKYKKNLTESERIEKKAEIEKIMLTVDNLRYRRDLESALIVLGRPDKNFDEIPAVVKTGGEYFKGVEIYCAIAGDIAFIGVPFEIYYSTGIKIQNIISRKYGCSTVFLLGYCGGYGGYLPPEDEFSRITYETIDCPFEKCGESKLLSAVKNI